jgi:fructoselysine 6-kinase
MKLVCVGECTVDRYLDLGLERVGGISLNFAVHARRCGVAQVALCTCVGDDASAALVRAKLAHEDVDATLLAERHGSTATQDIHMAPGGERIFPPGGYKPGVLAEWQPGRRELEAVASFQVLAVPIFRQVEHIAQAALSAPGFRGARVADFLDGADCGPDLRGLDRYLDVLDIAFVSGSPELAEALRPRSRATQTLIVVTHGAAGSTALEGGEPTSQPALTVADPVDTTGCGDAFQAAFTVSYLRRRNLRLALRAGARQAAGVIRYYGASG